MTDQKKPHADMTVEELMVETGFGRGYAEFFLAMARGEIESDVITVDRPKRRARKKTT